IDIDTYATYAECRARTKASNGYLQVLCVVVAVLNLNARYGRQTFREVNARPTAQQLSLADLADGGWCFQSGAWCARTVYDHRRQFNGLWLLCWRGLCQAVR